MNKGMIIGLVIAFASIGIVTLVTSQGLTVMAEQPPIKLIRTVQVTPDDHFLTGSFVRINYVPANDHFVVTFGTKASTQPGEIMGAGYVYKEYTLEMLPTGNTGILVWYPNSSEAGDSGSLMINNTYFCAFVSQNTTDPYGWRLIKYDAVNWRRLVEAYFTVEEPNEGVYDPMVAYINGQLDISNQYNPSGIFQLGASTNHHFFTADLQPISTRTLSDTPNIVGSSIVYVDGIYYYVTATSFTGNLVLMKYDSNWRYLGMKILILQAHWSTGMVFDGEHFYITYMDTSQRNGTYFLPVHLNVHLAVFDRNWDLIYDTAVTNFTPVDNRQPGRPWVILHENQLYVSYDVDSINPTTQKEELKWQAYVAIYEISQPAQGVAWPTWYILVFGIVIVAIVAVSYVLFKRPCWVWD